MSIPKFVTKNAHLLGRVVQNNSSSIMTAAGAIGIVGTAVLTQKGTVKAVRAMDNARYKRNLNTVSGLEPVPFSKKEKLAITWKCYAPAVGVASLSIAAVVGAQYVNTKRMATLAAGYVILEGKHEEYKDKVLELMGEKKKETIETAITQDMVNRSVIQEVEILAGDVPCIDALSNKVFSGNMEGIRKAVNDINERIVHGDQPSVSDLYSILQGGLKPTRLSDAFGWNDENMCEPKLTTLLDEAGIPVLVMDFSILPVGNFWKIPKS